MSTSSRPGRRNEGLMDRLSHPSRGSKGPRTYDLLSSLISYLGVAGWIWPCPLRSSPRKEKRPRD